MLISINIWYNIGPIGLFLYPVVSFPLVWGPVHLISLCVVLPSCGKLWYNN